MKELSIITKVTVVSWNSTVACWITCISAKNCQYDDMELQKQLSHGLLNVAIK